MLVFDSSTLILLAKISLLDAFLTDFTGEILIPKEGEKESTIKETLDGQLIRKRIDEKKITVKNVARKNVEKIMNDFAINMGEAEAIALATQEKDAVLATDDRNAINSCKVLRIHFVTAIDLLIRMKEKGILSKEDSSIKLKNLAEYGRYKQDIIKDALKKLGD